MIKDMHQIPDGAKVLVVLDDDVSQAEVEEVRVALTEWAPNANFVMLRGASAFVQRP